MDQHQENLVPKYLRPCDIKKYYGIHQSTLSKLRRFTPGFPQPYNFGLGFARVYKTEELERWFAEREGEARQRAAEVGLPPNAVNE